MKKENKKDSSLIAELSKGFSKLNAFQREQRLIQMGFLTPDDVKILKKETALNANLADHFVENVIGFFPMPLGVAVNFVIDDRDYIIPLAIEETSVIAGLSKIAKWIRHDGKLTTQNLSQLGLGQIQIPRVKNFNEVNKKIEANKDVLIEMVNKKVAHGIVARGGGVKEMCVRCIPRGDGDNMAVIHVMVDTCDAMGANIINQVCEFLKPHIQELIDEKVGMCILSNMPDTKITQAKIVIHHIEPELGEAIAEGSLFAQVDPFRAATNNKGVMNGMDGVLIATGNDWRAVEAGVHAYAAHSGKYTSITRWTMQNGDLHGVLEAPILVGIVGGVTRLHPIAQICLRILDVKSAAELARVVAAVGLVQNLAAIRALVTHGIIAGHMKLHISNLAMASGATVEELPILKQHLEERLATHKRLTGSDVKEIMKQIRKNNRIK